MSVEAYFRCPSCGRDAAMVSVASAAKIVGVSNRTIYVWVKQRRVHAYRTVGGHLRICQQSLLAGHPAGASGVVSGRTLSVAVLSVSMNDVRIRLALKIIERSYPHSALTLGMLAKQLDISIWYLGRMFKRHTGVGVRDYVRSLRLEKAQGLLRETLLSIKEVATAVGYKHVSDFDHHFKAAYGICPGEYRLLHLGARPSEEVGDDERGRS